MNPLVVSEVRSFPVSHQRHHQPLFQHCNSYPMKTIVQRSEAGQIPHLSDGTLLNGTVVIEQQRASHSTENNCLFILRPVRLSACSTLRAVGLQIRIYIKWKIYYTAAVKMSEIRVVNATHKKIWCTFPVRAMLH